MLSEVTVERERRIFPPLPHAESYLDKVRALCEQVVKAQEDQQRSDTVSWRHDDHLRHIAVLNPNEAELQRTGARTTINNPIVGVSKNPSHHFRRIVRKPEKPTQDVPLRRAIWVHLKRQFGSGLLEDIEQALQCWTTFTSVTQGLSGSPPHIDRRRLLYFYTSIQQHEENRLRLSLLAQLQKWQQTPQEKRWPDVTWPDDKAIEEARVFVKGLPLSALTSVHMGMAADGEINFSWNTEQVEIDLGFYGTRSCSYYAEDKELQRDIIGETFDPTKGLPKPLRKFFPS